MKGRLLSRFLLLQCMVALSLLKVVRCRYLCSCDGYSSCHYALSSVVLIFVTLMDGSLVIMEGSLLLRFLLFR